MEYAINQRQVPACTRTSLVILTLSLLITSPSSETRGPLVSGRWSGREVDKKGEIDASRGLVKATVYKTGGRAPGDIPLTD